MPIAALLANRKGFVLKASLLRYLTTMEQVGFAVLCDSVDWC